ncbi:MAG: hypothetical protein L3J32_07275, partial [Rhizobiaceae bacterium]|nr:hypothetical protein [Rhizobiaceae bacterium]
ESPWTLAYKNKRITAADKGKSWKFVRTMDSQQNNDSAANTLKESAKSAREVKCSEEEIDGVVHELVEARYDSALMGNAETLSKYWVNPETGWITKNSVYTEKMGSEFIQVMEKVPDLTLPTPE